MFKFNSTDFYKKIYVKVIINRSYCNGNATVGINYTKTIEVNKKLYAIDDWTNVTPNILSYTNRNLHIKKNHPLSIVRQRIVNYLYSIFVNTKGNPIFSVFDNLQQVVNIQQNFDNLLIPKNHPSRSKSDCYYINKDYLLRAHTTAHQTDLIKSGLDNFLVVGEVYRRDEIDSTHYPVFHQLDAVRTLHRDRLFPNNPELEIFESSYKINRESFLPIRSNLRCIDQSKQPCHTLEAVKLMEHEFKAALVGLVQHLFGKTIEYKWVDTYFPFTQPSWELEIFHKDQWFEVLGSGIIRNEILEKNGVNNTIGYAFGMGLERLAMILYDIPDIRLFWSNDSGFLNQFNDQNLTTKYKQISIFPQCINDISFWLPHKMDLNEFHANDFYDLVRDVAGDIVEQVLLIDKFKHPKSERSSICFRIVYRHMERTLQQNEVNAIHKRIGKKAAEYFKVEIR